jgi:hypothetical protein
MLRVFGPQMALAFWLDAISQGPKNSQFPVPNPLPVALASRDVSAQYHFLTFPILSDCLFKLSLSRKASNCAGRIILLWNRNILLQFRGTEDEA